jgi:hypothetical protein
VTVQLAIQGAVEEAAPEVTQVVVEGMTEAPGPALLQIERRPADEAGAGAGPAALVGSSGDGGGDGGGADGGNEAGWVTLPDIGPPRSPAGHRVGGGMSVLVCSVRGTLYAYRDACAARGSSLASGTLGASCRPARPAPRYDVRLAGKALDDPAAHDPLPLLADSRGVRVALPQAPARERQHRACAVSSGAPRRDGRGGHGCGGTAADRPVNQGAAADPQAAAGPARGRPVR